MSAPIWSCPMNVTRPSGVTPRVAAFAMSCSSAVIRSACPRVRPSASGSASEVATTSASPRKISPGSRSMATTLPSTMLNTASTVNSNFHCS